MQTSRRVLSGSVGAEKNDNFGGKPHRCEGTDRYLLNPSVAEVNRDMAILVDFDRLSEFRARDDGDPVRQCRTEFQI